MSLGQIMLKRGLTRGTFQVDEAELNELAQYQDTGIVPLRFQKKEASVVVQSVKANGAGFVTRFEVSSEFVARYPVQTVGASHHTEWWVPASELEELNSNIVGLIEVIGEYRA